MRLSNSDPIAAPHESAIGPKQTWASAPHISAFGGKADMTLCGNPLLRSLSGVKRTFQLCRSMSAIYYFFLSGQREPSSNRQLLATWQKSMDQMDERDSGYQVG
jgi:hypothetical protein